MGICSCCGLSSNFISNTLSVCKNCITKDSLQLKSSITTLHNGIRQRYGLGYNKSNSNSGVVCNLCGNRCKINNSTGSYCGLRKIKNGRVVGPDKYLAALTYYYDHLPTNCVADWICAGGTGCGFPRFARIKGPQIGYKNLAVFYIGCSFNCLFCQNAHFRDMLANPPYVDVDTLLKAIDEKTDCICYFGGDPSCQIEHSVFFSKKAMEKKRNRILRICWETNGNINPTWINSIMEIALETGGCVKFDLKCYDEKLNISLCGISNKLSYENFVYASKFFSKRREPPVLVASTLLIPGYIDKEEVYKIANFIARLNRDIPYTLLGFAPQFLMSDLPYTSKAQAYMAVEVAKKAGLKNVYIGNIHLLRTNLMEDEENYI